MIAAAALIAIGLGCALRAGVLWERARQRRQTVLLGRLRMKGLAEPTNYSR